MIPLLLLDVLAMEEVLNNFDVIELLNLSLLSKRATNIVRSIIRRRNVEHKLHVWISDELFVRFEENKGGVQSFWSLHCEPKPSDRILDESKELSEFNKILFDVSNKEEYQLFYFTDVKAGFFALMNQLTNLYTKTVSHFQLEYDADLCAETFDFFKSQQIKIEHANLKMEEFDTDQEICLILDKLALASIESATIYDMEPSEEFIRNDVRQFKTPKLTIEKARWVTIDRLLTMDCKSLDIDSGSILTEENLNFLLKQWVQGGMQNLEQLTLMIIGSPMDNVLNGVPHQENIERDAPRASVFHVVGYDVHNVFDIRRNDGTVAVLYRTYPIVIPDPRIPRCCVFRMEVLGQVPSPCL